MRTDIKTNGIEVTRQMRERLDWICSKLEKMANAKDPDALHCEIVVTQAAGTTDEAEFQAEIKFFDGSGETHIAKATAGDPLVALDIAHDEIERKYFQGQRMKHEKQRIQGFTDRRAEQIKEAVEKAKKVAKEAPPRGKKGSRDEE